MKNIYRIARVELAEIFFSPIAWLSLIIFTFQFGYLFIDKLEAVAVVSGSPEPAKTALLYSNAWGQGLFVFVQNYLFFYVPVFTMGLISRELQSGSIKLVFSSPVTVRELVLGKYMAIVTFGSILLSVIAAFGIAGMVILSPVEWPIIISGFAGVFLLFCLYSAIGLFMSCCTSYPVVAAIGTFVVLAALNYVGTVWQQYDLYRHISDVLDITGRSAHLIGGLLSSKDLIYFVLICVLFLGLAMTYLQTMRRSESRVRVVGRYVVLVLAVIVAGSITNMPRLVWYKDITQTGRQSVSKGTQSLLTGMDDRLTVTIMGNVLQGGVIDQALPERKSRVYVFFERYQRFLKKDLNIQWVYFYDSLSHSYAEPSKLTLEKRAKNAAITYGLDTANILSPLEARKIYDTKYEWGRSVMLLEYKGRHALVRFPFGPLDDTEPELAAALRELYKPAADLVFLKGHNERSYSLEDDRDYSDRFYFTGSGLIFKGFNMRFCTPDQLASLDTSALLVLSDPTMPYNDTELSHIKSFLDKGGNAWIAGDPKRKSIIAPIADYFGLRYCDSQFISHIPFFDSNLVQLNFAPQAAGLSPQIGDLQGLDANIYCHDISPLAFTGSSKFTVRPYLLNSDTGTWVRKGDVHNGGKTFNRAVGDARVALPVGFSITRDLPGRQQRILFFSHGGIPANNEFSGLPKKNEEMIEESFGWLNYNIYPVDISRPHSVGETAHLDRAQWKRLRILVLWIFPGLLLLGGAAWLVDRNRR